jgi:ATP-dependent DNA helicase
LDFLLSKASEYSNFIAKDLDELQAGMQDQAIKASKKAEKKKRKNEVNSIDKDSKSKRRKPLAESSDKLETAQAKDAESRQSSKPIFIQPPNLAKDCVLKDYQLEGVRWLASLYENGVSGILADGKSSLNAVLYL